MQTPIIQNFTITSKTLLNFTCIICLSACLSVLVAHSPETYSFQIADSMEVNILEILAPILKCEWLLSDLQIALYSSVRK